MRKNKLKWFFVLVSIIIAATLTIRISRKKSDAEIVKEVMPVIGSIRKVISSTGTVLPKNRLEVKPPVNGRIEKVLVSEGQKVNSGDILVWMSSTERAALLDAARGKGEETLRYWEESYKPILLPAPIEAEVIVATIQPGQTVTISDAVVVLSDHLIVRAQVDETDIAKVSLEMKAIITLDAYPDTKIPAFVEHVYYESKTVNNVTIYEVDLKPQKVPEFLRSGMNASVDFIAQSKEDALLIPEEAVLKEGDEDYVLVKRNKKKPEKVKIELGISEGKKIEVISGLEENDTLIVKTKKYNLPKDANGSNPFLPSRRRQ